MTRDILIWWVAVQAIGLAGLPLARFLFSALPDRGYAFSKALGLLLTGYLAWLLAMLGLGTFSAGLVVACMLALAGAGLLLNRRAGADAGGGPLAWLREHWRMVLGYEALFALALVFLALLRSHDAGFTGPHPWGTERPMDYAFFNAIRRSPSFPPHDPWLAGYSINYYYFGYLLMACVALVSGLDPAVAFNLSLALTFALTALGVAGLVANLIGLSDAGRRAADPPPTGEQPPPTAGRGPPAASGRWALAVGRPLAAALAVALVLLAGNQSGALQLIVGDNRVVALDGRQLGAALAQALRGEPQIALPYPTNAVELGNIESLERRDRVAEFDWWWPSRVVWDDFSRRGDPVHMYTITEFPFFSFWLGDMHPHVMALPFGLLALALALQTLARPRAPAFAQGRRGWAELLLVGVVLGSLYAINSWDLPTYVLLFLGALLILFVRLDSEQRSAISDARPQPPAPAGWRRDYLTQAALVLAAAALLFLPFHLTFRSLVGGKEPLTTIPVLATLSRTLGLVTWSHTALHSFLIIFGLFLLPLLAFVAAQGFAPARPAASDAPAANQAEDMPEAAGASPADAEAPAASSEGRAAESPARPPLAAQSPWRYLLPGAAAALLVGLMTGFPLLALLPLALYAGVLALDQAGRPAAAFTLWAFALGCLICFGTDVVYIRDVFESRMNTIFKFYYQTWLIWGALAGYALWWLGGWLFAARRPVWRPIVGALISALFLLLLAGGLVYPWLTAGKAFREAPRIGLAGKTPRQHTPEGEAAINWLRANTPGDAVVLEAIDGSSYDPSGLGIGGVSASTGLATVLGWPGHEQQWRGGSPEVLALIDPRKSDVATIYGTTDTEQARELLKKYGVRYIYVGPAERANYPAEGFAKFDQIAAPVFQQGEVTIYEVKQ